MNIRQLLNLKETKGDVGIEIEVEGNNLAPIRDALWRSEHDGSLRGESLEFVLKKPVAADMVGVAVDRLTKHLKDNGCEVIESPRAGTHIHINVQELTLTELFSFMTLYMCFEETLVRYCGPDRIGNLFCFRVCDAEGLLPVAIQAARTGQLQRLRTDKIRYASMNLKAITEYGSLEFRAMRGTVDKEVLLKWTGMLMAIREYARQFAPNELVSNFSMQGPQDFFNAVLGEYRDDLMPATAELMEGMRNAQELAFCRKWEGAFVEVIQHRERMEALRAEAMRFEQDDEDEDEEDIA